jgi:Lipocalin-like domain
MKQDSASLTKNLKANLLWIWQLKSRVDLDSSGQRHIDPVLGADPLGILCFSEGYFPAQYMKRDRSNIQDSQQLVRGSNISSVLNGFDGHFGTYILDETSGILKVRLEGALSPDDIGREFERHIHVQGDQLTIKFATTSADAAQVTRTRTISRLA